MITFTKVSRTTIVNEILDKYFKTGFLTDDEKSLLKEFGKNL